MTSSVSSEALAGGDRRVVGRNLLLEGVDGAVEVAGQIAGETALELGLLPTLDRFQAGLPTPGVSWWNAGPARRHASSTSSGMTKGSASQLRCLRVAAISSAPSGEPCTLWVPALFGAPKPIVVLAAMKVGRSDLWASSMAAAIASGSWPSISIVCQ